MSRLQSGNCGSRTMTSLSGAGVGLVIVKVNETGPPARTVVALGTLVARMSGMGVETMTFCAR